jgi:hypothetical protein
MIGAALAVPSGFLRGAVAHARAHGLIGLLGLALINNYVYTSVVNSKEFKR